MKDIELTPDLAMMMDYAQETYRRLVSIMLDIEGMTGIKWMIDDDGKLMREDEE